MITEDFAAYAARVRVRFAAPTAPEKIQGMLESFMSGTAMDCLEAGTRLIGHIKSVVDNNDQIIACSVTDHDGKVRCQGHFEAPQTQVDVIINVLQYSLAKKEMVRVVDACSKRSFTGTVSIIIEDLEIGEKDLIRLG